MKSETKKLCIACGKKKRNRTRGVEDEALLCRTKMSECESIAQ
jgi:hypothetical protein